MKVKYLKEGKVDPDIKKLIDAIKKGINNITNEMEPDMFYADDEEEQEMRYEQGRDFMDDAWQNMDKILKLSTDVKKNKKKITDLINETESYVNETVDGDTSKKVDKFINTTAGNIIKLKDKLGIK